MGCQVNPKTSAGEGCGVDSGDGRTCAGSQYGTTTTVSAAPSGDLAGLSAPVSPYGVPGSSSGVLGWTYGASA